MKFNLIYSNFKILRCVLFFQKRIVKIEKYENKIPFFVHKNCVI